MQRLAVAFVVVAVAVTAAQASAAKGWHRCEKLGSGLASLCDGRGHVLFPYIIERNENSGYTQVVRGFHRTGARRAIVDAYADWGVSQGECGQNGVYMNCLEWGAEEHIQYRTSDGGRTWLPVSFHREATKSEGAGPGPPKQTGSVEDDPPLRPCNWSHANRHHVLVEGMRSGYYGNWCAPPDEWKIPDSLKPRGA
jgi:hypothetical protein